MVENDYSRPIYLRIKKKICSESLKKYSRDNLVFFYIICVPDENIDFVSSSVCQREILQEPECRQCQRLLHLGAQHPGKHSQQSRIQRDSGQR